MDSKARRKMHRGTGPRRGSDLRSNTDPRNDTDLHRAHHRTIFQFSMFLITLSLLSPRPLHAVTRPLLAAPNPLRTTRPQKEIMTFRAAPLRESAVTFALGFTLGTHEGKASAAQGELKAELQPFSVRGGFIEVPIASLSSDDEKRDCHMRESLGLDYAKSDFPDSHVCEDGKLPGEGKNAVVFPTIRFDIASVTAPSAKGGTIEKGVAIAHGKWTIHGVTRESAPIPVTITRLLGKKAAFRVHGSTPLSLKEYGIIVKNFLFISVSDQATANFDLVFGEK